MMAKPIDDSVFNKADYFMTKIMEDTSTSVMLKCGMKRAMIRFDNPVFNQIP